MKINILKKKILIILSSILLAVSLVVFCALLFKERLLSKKPVVHYLEEEERELRGPYCVDKSEFVIGNIPYGITEAQVLNIKGPPLEKTVWDCDILYYEDIEVTFWRGSMFGLKAISTSATTPSGISLGMSKNDIFSILGVSPDRIDMMEMIEGGIYHYVGREYQFWPCEFAPYGAMTLEFDSEGILQTLNIANDIP